MKKLIRKIILKVLPSDSLVGLSYEALDLAKEKAGIEIRELIKSREELSDLAFNMHKTKDYIDDLVEETYLEMDKANQQIKNAEMNNEIINELI